MVRALEGSRRGRVSVEHVLNVLPRLSAVPALESAAIALLRLTDAFGARSQGNADNMLPQPGFT